MRECGCKLCLLRDGVEKDCEKCGFNKEIENCRKKELREQFHTHNWKYPFALRIKAGD